MLKNETKTHFVTTVYGWIKDIQNRTIGLSGMTMLYKTHMEFIEYIMEEADNSTFEEYKERCTLLMNHHAMARNDIYDGTTYSTCLDKDGQEKDTWHTVSREEKDIRMLLHAWYEEPLYDCGCINHGDDENIGCESCGHQSCLDCHQVNATSSNVSEWICYEGHGCQKED